MNPAAQAVVASKSAPDAASAGIGGILAMVIILGAVFYMSASEPDKPQKTN